MLSVDRTCPMCGGTAAVHARIVRAVHDWGQTFVPCERLRCCNRTWTAAPRGLTPRARYSDRVVALARALVSGGVSRRRCAALLRQAGVPVTAQSIATWCRGVRSRAPGRAALASAPDSCRSVLLRPGLWLNFHSKGGHARTAKLLAALTVNNQVEPGC